MLLATALAIGALSLLIERTRIGIAFRAVSANPFASRVCGLDLRRVQLFSWIAAAVLWNGAGAINPEGRLWAAFMLVQSLPFAAAVLVSMVNALEQMRHAQAVFEAAPPALATAPAMQPAQ